MTHAYDETRELYRYVSFNRRELMTPLEREAETLGMLREKARASDNEDVRQALVKKYNAWKNEQALRLIGDDLEGLRSLQASVADRITTEIASGRVVVNRCPACSRIVKTPLARQCLWCGHDWHNGNDQ